VHAPLNRVECDRAARNHALGRPRFYQATPLDPVALARALIKKATSQTGTTRQGHPREPGHPRQSPLPIDDDARDRVQHAWQGSSARHPTSGSWPQHTARALSLQRSFPAPLMIRGDPCQRLEPRHDQHSVSADHDDTPISPTSSVAPIRSEHHSLWPVPALTRVSGRVGLLEGLGGHLS
jgi:hypothetical protein